MQHLGSDVPEQHAALFGFVHARAAEDRTALAIGGADPLLADTYELALAAIAAATVRGFSPADVELLALAALDHADHPAYDPAWRTLLHAAGGSIVGAAA